MSGNQIADDLRKKMRKDLTRAISHYVMMCDVGEVEDTLWQTHLAMDTCFLFAHTIATIGLADDVADKLFRETLKEARGMVEKLDAECGNVFSTK